MSRRRRPARAPTTALQKLRPWFAPILFLLVLATLYKAPLDTEALAEELAAGRPDAALERLSTTRREEFAPGLAEVRWWPPEARRLRMQQLRQEDPYESLEHPTLVEPLDAWRSPPTRVRLREAATEDLLLRIENLELGLLVTELPVPRGTQELPLEVSFIPGTTFVMRLMKPEQALPVALGAFELLPSPRAEELGLVLRTAWDLGGDEHGGELLAALAALHHGLHAEAIQRLERLAEVEGYEQVSRELRALALMEQGLDRTALELVDRPTG